LFITLYYYLYKMKFKFIINFFIYIFLLNIIGTYGEKGYVEKYKFENIDINSLEKFFKSKIKRKSVLIYEPMDYHNECLPGYVKYFLELGYNVDILILKNQEDALILFQPRNKIRVFLYENKNIILKKINEIRKKFKIYDFVLIQTMQPWERELAEHLGKLKNTIFVLHNINEIFIKKYLNNNRIITIGNYKEGIYVNPHYFGDINFKNKNDKTKFFLTATKNRKYNLLLNAAEILTSEGFDFEIFITGRDGTIFNNKNIPDIIKNRFKIKYKLPFKSLYKEIEKSDYIVLTLDPENEYDNRFKNGKASGSAQLSLGFLKPILINNEFSKYYNFTNENSFLYEKITL